jgi:hypothetical protein
MTDNLSVNKNENAAVMQMHGQEPDLNTSSENESKKVTEPKKENLLINILMNIVIPTLILTKMSGDTFLGHPWGLGAKWGLIVALSFPIVYGVKDFITRRKFNFFSALGIVSVLLTGSISLLHLDTKYYAIKEAAIPGLIGLLVIISTRTRYPLVKTFIYNDTILKVDKIAAILKERGNEILFEKTLRNGSYFIAISFFISSLLNYILAKIIVVSPTGTPEFNVEIGKMHAIGFPVIAVPSLIIMIATLMYIFRSIRQLTDLTMEDVMHDDSDKKK